MTKRPEVPCCTIRYAYDGEGFNKAKADRHHRIDELQSSIEHMKQEEKSAPKVVFDVTALPSESTVKVTAFPSSKVSDVKSALQIQDEITLGGMGLVDSSTLSDNGIEDGAILHTHCKHPLPTEVLLSNTGEHSQSQPEALPAQTAYGNVYNITRVLIITLMSPSLINALDTGDLEEELTRTQKTPINEADFNDGYQYYNVMCFEVPYKDYSGPLYPMPCVMVPPPAEQSPLRGPGGQSDV